MAASLLINIVRCATYDRKHNAIYHNPPAKEGASICFLLPTSLHRTRLATINYRLASMENIKASKYHNQRSIQESTFESYVFILLCFIDGNNARHFHRKSVSRHNGHCQDNHSFGSARWIAAGRHHLKMNKVKEWLLAGWKGLSTFGADLSSSIAVVAVVVLDAVGRIGMNSVRMSGTDMVVLILIMAVHVVLIANWPIATIDLVGIVAPILARLIQLLFSIA